MWRVCVCQYEKNTNHTKMKILRIFLRSHNVDFLDIYILHCHTLLNLVIFTALSQAVWYSALLSQSTVLWWIKGLLPSTVMREGHFLDTDYNTLVRKWVESGFRPPLCTHRLNWAKRTFWGWCDEWDDTEYSGESAVYHSACQRAGFCVCFYTLWYSCGISTRQWEGYNVAQILWVNYFFLSNTCYTM